MDAFGLQPLNIDKCALVLTKYGLQDGRAVSSSLRGACSQVVVRSPHVDR